MSFHNTKNECVVCRISVDITRLNHHPDVRGGDVCVDCYKHLRPPRPPATAITPPLVPPPIIIPENQTSLLSNVSISRHPQNITITITPLATTPSNNIDLSQMLIPTAVLVDNLVLVENLPTPVLAENRPTPVLVETPEIKNTNPQPIIKRTKKIIQEQTPIIEQTQIQPEKIKTRATTSKNNNNNNDSVDAKGFVYRKCDQHSNRRTSLDVIRACRAAHDGCRLMVFTRDRKRESIENDDLSPRYPKRLKRVLRAVRFAR